MQEKRDVMRFKYLLKGEKNRDDKQMFINDYTPAATNERRKREKSIIRGNEQREGKDDVEMKYVKGRLQIQGQFYRQKVLPPTLKDLVNLTPKELDAILKMDVQGPSKTTKDMSIFSGYMARVQTHQQIRQLYTKIRLMEPDSRHVVCAYSIPGGEDYYCKDFCDDDEPGAGQILLDYIKQKGYDEIAIFVSRKFGESKWGTRDLTAIEMLLLM